MRERHTLRARKRNTVRDSEKEKKETVIGREIHTHTHT